MKLSINTAALMLTAIAFILGQQSVRYFDVSKVLSPDGVHIDDGRASALRHSVLSDGGEQHSDGVAVEQQFVDTVGFLAMLGADTDAQASSGQLYIVLSAGAD